MTINFLIVLIIIDYNHIMRTVVITNDLTTVANINMSMMNLL